MLSNEVAIEPTIRDTGPTKTQRKPAVRADKNFLDLWSYPSTFNDRDLRNGHAKVAQGEAKMSGNIAFGTYMFVATWPKRGARQRTTIEELSRDERSRLVLKNVPMAHRNIWRGYRQW